MSSVTRFAEVAALALLVLFLFWSVLEQHTLHFRVRFGFPSFAVILLGKCFPLSLRGFTLNQELCSCSQLCSQTGLACREWTTLGTVSAIIGRHGFMDWQMLHVVENTWRTSDSVQWTRDDRTVAIRSLGARLLLSYMDGGHQVLKPISCHSVANGCDLYIRRWFLMQMPTKHGCMSAVVQNSQEQS